MNYKWVIVFLAFGLTGCSHSKSIWQDKASRLEASTCMQCADKPFYVNGRWLDND